MTAMQIDNFFRGYAEAFSRFDVDAVCSAWAYPAFFAYRGERAALSEKEFRTNTEHLCKLYKAQGMAKSSKAVVEVARLTETTASVRTADKILDAAGETIIQWEHVYLLSDTADGIKVVCAFPDEELAAWDARRAALS